MTETGTEAPDFDLEVDKAHRVRLSDFRGKRNVLLAFFPLAFTKTCTAEMCAFSDDYAQFHGSTLRAAMNRMLPPTIRPGGCTRRKIAMAVVVLPQPDSPTRPSVSPS